MTTQHDPNADAEAQAAADEKAEMELLAAEKAQAEKKSRNSNRKLVGLVLVVAAFANLDLKKLKDPTANESYLIGYYSIPTLMAVAGIFMLLTSPPPKKPEKR